MFAKFALTTAALLLMYMSFRAFFMFHSTEQRKTVATCLAIVLFMSSIYVLTLVK